MLSSEIEEIVEALREVGSERTLAAMLGHGLQLKGIPESRAGLAGESCAKQIMQNAYLGGAAAAVIVVAVTKNPIAALLSGVSIGVVSGVATHMLSDACRGSSFGDIPNLNDVVDEMIRFGR